MRRAAAVVFLSAFLTAFTPAFAQRTGGPAGATMGHIGGYTGGSFVHSPGSYGHTAPGFVSRAPSFVSTPGNFVSMPGNFVSTAPSHAFVPLNHVPTPPPSANGLDQGRQGRGWHDHDHDGDRGHNRDHDRDRHRSQYGYGYGGYPYAYASSWTLLPWDLGTSDVTGTSDEPAAATEQQPPTSLTPTDDTYRPEYNGATEPPAEYASAPAEEPSAPPIVAPEPALTLIFTDGHREDIHNYVLTSDSLIVLDEAASGHQKRIPLSTLDLQATQQTAQQEGLEFTPPA